MARIEEDVDALIDGARQQWDDAYEAEDLPYANILRRLAVQEALLREIAIDLKHALGRT